MNYLFEVIKKLNAKERLALLRKIKTQKLKLKLYNFLLDDEGNDKVVMGNLFSSGKPSNNLYMLKNRLLDDIVEVKQEITKNDLIEVKLQVQYLSTFLMNGENDLLLRELKKLEKSTIRFEMYTKLKEVYYIYLLMYGHTAKVKEKFLALIENNNRKIDANFEAEKLFYSKLTAMESLFYYPNKKLLTELKAAREKMQHYSQLLQNHTGKFYLLCMDALIGLSSFFNPATAIVLFKQLQNISKLYDYTFLKKRFPMGSKFIDCLYLRYYYLTNDRHFTPHQRSLYPDILKMANHILYANSYLFFIHISVVDYLRVGKKEQVVALLSKVIKDNDCNNSRALQTIQIHYLLAVKEYYSQNYTSSSSLLIKARNFFKEIDLSSAWLVIEVLLLNLLNIMYLKEFIYLEHEIGVLRRYFLKFKIDSEHIKAFNKLFKAIREYEKTLDETAVKESIELVQKETQLMQLLLEIKINAAYSS